MSEKICSIDFFQGSENIGNSTFTIEEAKKAGTKNIDKFPKNMLFARAISNGVKWFCPDVFAGPVYVPEEMPEQTIEDVPHVVVIEEKPIPTLNDKQMAKLLESGKENIEKYLNLIEEGKLDATQVQVLNLEDKLTELRKI
jgi:hypothetical protein